MLLAHVGSRGCALISRFCRSCCARRLSLKKVAFICVNGELNILTFFVCGFRCTYREIRSTWQYFERETCCFVLSHAN